MKEIKNIAIIGLGLIGGSLAKAIAERTGYHIMARNRTRATLLQAMEDGAVHEELTDDNIGQADMIILGLYPEEAVEYMDAIGGSGDIPAVLLSGEPGAGGAALSQGG